MKLAVTITMIIALAGSAHAAKEVRYAIVIGNNAPPTSGTAERLEPLRYADDDAVRYYQLLSRLGEAHLLAVLDATTQRRYVGLAARAVPPTAQNLRDLVSTLAAKMAADRKRGDRPVLYFVFSGHGARDAKGDAFLALQDASLTQQALYEDVLGKLPAVAIHVMVDACNAGGVVGVRGGGFFGTEKQASTARATDEDLRPILEATPLGRYPHIGVILATTLGQEAHEWSAIEGGVFTHELLSGLAGAADVNGDRVVEYSEVQAFVASANRDIKDPRAIPQVIAQPPAANRSAVLVAINAMTNVRLVTGDASKLGRFYIELDNGERYLDAHLSTKTAAIALPAEGTAYLRAGDREAVLPARTNVVLGQLRLAARAVASRGSIDAEYRDALFASDYGRSYYQGFVDSVGALGVQFADVGVRRDTATTSQSKRPAVASAVVAGVAATSAIVTGALALSAKHDYETTNLQRPAEEARARYDRYLPIAIGSGAVAVAAGALSVYLWPRGTTRLAPAATGDTYSLGVEMKW
jgi:hypothetical protein